MYLKTGNCLNVAVLLHALGEEALKVHNNFDFLTTEDERTVEEILDKFDALYDISTKRTGMKDFCLTRGTRTMAKGLNAFLQQSDLL